MKFKVIFKLHEYKYFYKNNDTKIIQFISRFLFEKKTNKYDEKFFNKFFI